MSRDTKTKVQVILVGTCSLAGAIWTAIQGFEADGAPSAIVGFFYGGLISMCASAFIFILLVNRFSGTGASSEDEASRMHSFQPSPTLQKLRKWLLGFGFIFLVAFAIYISSRIRVVPPASTDPSDPILPLLISVASLITSAIALIGFILTTILAWKKEKRELRSFDLDNAKKELEIAKLRAELDKERRG